MRLLGLRPQKGAFLSVTDVRYVPLFSRNLFSLGMFDDLGCTFSCENGILNVKRGCRTILKAKKHGKLYFLQGKTHTREVNAVFTKDETNLWHSKLGHVSQKGLDTLTKK